MSKMFLRILFLNIPLSLFGQEFIYDLHNKNVKDVLADTSLANTELLDNFINYDFSNIWTLTENSCIVGFIGNDKQRIRIKLISIVKINDKTNVYYVLGKSLVKNNICHFKGKIEMVSIRKNKHMFDDCESDKFKNVKSEGVLIAKYEFFEDSTELYSGYFKGDLISLWYLNLKNEIQYNDIHRCADGFCNNQFIGTWNSYKNKSSKICNWGDYRIPFSGDLDIGAGEFSPDDKYLKYGWQTIRDAYFKFPPSNEAKKEEEKIWWK
jgi:hypothetical protein